MCEEEQDEGERAFTHTLQLYKGFKHRFGTQWKPLDTWRVLPLDFYSSDFLIAYVCYTYGCGPYRVSMMVRKNIISVLRFVCKPDRRPTVSLNKWSEIFIE